MRENIKLRASDVHSAADLCDLCEIEGGRAGGETERKRGEMCVFERERESERTKERGKGKERDVSFAQLMHTASFMYGTHVNASCCCSVLQCVAVCCYVLQCVANMMQCDAV